jgi:hypothetical protein
MTSAVAIGTLLFLLVVAAGAIVLQVFLSKKESKWLGLILPVISFGISLIVLLGFPLFAVYSTEVSMNGAVVEQAVSQTDGLSTIIGAVVYLFVLYNIPTAVLLAIYAACRGKRKQQRDLEKMSVQDLE